MIEEISDWEIKKAKNVLNAHVVKPLTREGALESLLFCIASQAWAWEPASKFVYDLRQKSYPDDFNALKKYASLDVLNDKKLVNKIAKENGWRFHHQDRFDAPLDYFEKQNGLWYEDVMNADSVIRTEYCKNVKWVSNKTFSFWHICLGGTNLLALDVHVMKNLSDLGLSVNESYFISRPRLSGNQKVRKTPNNKDYIRIEEDAKTFFSYDERFLLDNQKVNLALVDSLLWWRGANRGSLKQMNLFKEHDIINYLPYANLL